MRRALAVSTTIAAVVAGGALAAGALPAAGAVDSRRATVSMSEFRFAPARPTVDRGRVTFRLRNVGRFPHALEIERAGRRGRDVASPTLTGGRSATWRVTLRRGRYVVLCPVGNHRRTGMRGRLTVR